MTSIITNLPPLSDEELYENCIAAFKKLMALTFSVDVNELDVNELDVDKTANIQRILDAIDSAYILFEPTPLDEPVGEIYRDDKLIGYIMCM